MFLGSFRTLAFTYKTFLSLPLIFFLSVTMVYANITAPKKETFVVVVVVLFLF